jgi:hypothetical protein
MRILQSFNKQLPRPKKAVGTGFSRIFGMFSMSSLVIGKIPQLAQNWHITEILVQRFYAVLYALLHNSLFGPVENI